MWKQTNNSYFKMKNESGEDLLSALVYHDKEDGAKEPFYAVQIYPNGGGIVTIGEILESDFDLETAKVICNMAVQIDNNFYWWERNGREWFNIIINEK